jgi:hypothetical protein
MKPLGGKYEIDGYLNTLFNPGKLNIGSHKLIYHVNSKSCFAKDSFNIAILDSIHLILSPNNDSLCKGEMAILQSKATGGIGNYTFWWSNGQNGYKTIVSPKTNITYTCYASDGCSVLLVIHGTKSISRANDLLYETIGEGSLQLMRRQQQKRMLQ